MKAVGTAGWRPERQDSEGLVTRRATTAPDTDNIVHLVVRLFAPLAVADESAVSTERTQAWQYVQRKRVHPRIEVVFCFRQCDKENQRLA